MIPLNQALNRPELGPLLDTLVASDHLSDADRTRALAHAHHQLDAAPWYIEALVGAGAWLAMGLFLLFLTLLDTLDQPYIWGPLFYIGGHLAARMSHPGKTFLRQLALTASLLGHALLIIEVGQGEMLGTGASTAILGGISLWLFPGLLHRLISACGVLVGFGVVILDLGHTGGIPELNTFPLIAALCWLLMAAAWLREAQWISTPAAPWHRPVATALTLTALIALLPTVYADATIGWRAAIPTAAIGLGLMVSIHHTTALLSVRSGARTQLHLGALALCILSWPAPGVAGSLLIILLATHGKRPVILGIGVIGLLHYLAAFYYHLGLTLGAKAAALTGAGLMLLLIRTHLKRARP